MILMLQWSPFHGAKYSKNIYRKNMLLFCGPMVLCLCQSMCLALTGGGAGIAADRGSDGFHLVWPFGNEVLSRRLFHFGRERCLTIASPCFAHSYWAICYTLVSHQRRPSPKTRRILARFWKSCQKCRVLSLSVASVKLVEYISRWFQMFVIFTPTCGNDPV